MKLPFIYKNKSMITRRFKIVPNSNIIQFVLNSTISGKIGTNYALVTLTVVTTIKSMVMVLNTAVVPW